MTFPFLPFTSSVKYPHPINIVLSLIKDSFDVCEREAEDQHTGASLPQCEGNSDAFACLHTDFSRL